jgi:hypothetical protein
LVIAPPQQAINSYYCLLASAAAAGVIALDLARELLGQHPNSIALVVSHENITNNYYSGSDKSMLIPNVGGWFGVLQRLLCLVLRQHVTAC